MGHNSKCDYRTTDRPDLTIKEKGISCACSNDDIFRGFILMNCNNFRYVDILEVHSKVMSMQCIQYVYGIIKNSGRASQYP